MNAALKLVQGQSDISALIDSWLKSKSPSTATAYMRDLKTFASFMGAESAERCVEMLISMTALRMKACINEWREQLLKRGLSGSRINRLLSTLRSLLNEAHDVEMVERVPRIRDTKAVPVRDVAGPGEEALKDMLAASADSPRDFALMCLLCIHGLRRSEVLSLRVMDVNESSINIKRKGIDDRIRVTTSTMTTAALRRHLSTLGPRRLQEKIFNLTGNGLWYVVNRYADKCGVKASPHALRHTAVTLACVAANEQGIPIEEVRHFSGHASLPMVIRYRDRLSDVQNVLAQGLEGKLL